MRFIDEARIRISAGNGGSGCVSFRREKCVPNGGPDGGNGGRGGDIVFKASSQLGTLQDFRYRRVIRAENGRAGSGANKTGSSGDSIVVLVPLGTVLKDAESGEVLADLSEDGQLWTAVEGGRGGKGNAHFTTSTFQAPKFSQPGELGQSKELILELKLLADAGILGYPNAGKSTLISRLSAARPKIADYPFTTLTPNLGVVDFRDLGEFRSMVVADIPGLVDGSHLGVGLGHKFLRHLERTKFFLHVIDGAKLLESENPLQAAKDLYMAIREELGRYDRALLEKPEIVVLNKTDLLEVDTIEKVIQGFRQEMGCSPLPVSAVTGQGIRELRIALKNTLPPEEPLHADAAPTSKMA